MALNNRLFDDSCGFQHGGAAAEDPGKPRMAFVTTSIALLIADSLISSTLCV